jgi:hypothetical protein
VKVKKLRPIDYLCIASLILLAVVLNYGSGTGQGNDVPLDDRHRAVYDAIKSGRSRVETELVCATCHSKSSIPLPKKHPPKDECLLCHLLAG